MLEIDVVVEHPAFSLLAELGLAGGTLALCGPSGVGKSTLLRAVAGLERRARGRVVMGGVPWLDTAAGTNLPPAARRVGFVPQAGALFPHLPVWRNVAFGVPGPRAGRRGLAESLLERFGLGGFADARPHELSGGERQRVALARALAAGSGLLLLDEPLSALDTAARLAAVTELRRSIDAAAVPTIIVTHDFAEAAGLAGDIAVMSAGRVIRVGTPEALVDDPRAPEVAALVGANTVRDGVGGTWAVYPGDVRVARPADVGPVPATRGIVTAVVPSAEQARLTVSTGAGTVLADVARDDNWRPGDVAEVSWNRRRRLDG